jgi:iron(III) transport system substrate-binding protein
MSRFQTRRGFLRLAVLGGGTALLAACTGASSNSPASSGSAASLSSMSMMDELYEGAKKEGKVVWWDTHESKVAQKFIDAFKQKYPGIDVEFFEGAQDEFQARAVAEARANRISFDVLDTSRGYLAFKEAGFLTNNAELLQEVGIPLEQQFEGTYAPEWTVYGATYNTNLVPKSELPRRWDDFLDPKWRGKIAVESRLWPFIYGTPFLGGEDKVVEYLKKLREQNPRFTRDNTGTDTLLMAGEYSLAIGTYMHNWLKFGAKGQPWGFVPLDEVWTAHPGAGYTVPTSAPHPNAGRLFMAWFVGPEGTAISDVERFKGNPLPGTGTGPSKMLEENQMTVRVSSLEYEQNYKKYQVKYQEALGLPIG